MCLEQGVFCVKVPGSWPNSYIPFVLCKIYACTHDRDATLHKTILRLHFVLKISFYLKALQGVALKNGMVKYSEYRYICQRAVACHDQTQSGHISKVMTLTPVSLEILPKSFQKLQDATESLPATRSTCGKSQSCGESSRETSLCQSAEYKNHPVWRKEQYFNIQVSVQFLLVRGLG